MLTAMLTPVLYRVTRIQGGRALRAFDRRTARCADTQRRVLREKVARAAGTAYGRRHRFSSIRTPDDYRAAVPIVDYEALRPWVERILRGERDVLFPAGDGLLMFAMTSGTTGTPKYVPVTRPYCRELQRGNFVWGVRVIGDHPGAIAGKILHIVSPSRECDGPGGVPCGAATGLVAESQRAIARIKYAIPLPVFRIPDYAAKYYCILRLALRERISLAIAANPSTLVSLADCLSRNAERLIRDVRDGTLSADAAIDPAVRSAVARRCRPDRPRAAALDRACARRGTLLPVDAWPDLRVLSCWTGGTLTPWLDLVRRSWGDAPLRDPGLIASEGRMTIPLEDGGRGGVLDVASHFFEFIPYGGGGARTLLAHELEEGGTYFLIMTTSSGFFRYNISDVVRVNGFHGDTPIVQFLHKGSRISSLTGEKLSEHQVVEAFRACERQLAFEVPQFTVCPGWGEPPRYVILLEDRRDGLFAGGRLLDAIAEQFDRELRERNMEYGGKRDSGRLGPPAARLVQEGSFDGERAARICRSGGRMEQYKHAYLNPSLDHCSRFRLVDGDEVPAGRCA
ncbi:MAG: GH3 auxin-responsive promoter family protein [bacterium]|nr:GH3 auxin-responsive promoter family protein [bacterium]